MNRMMRITKLSTREKKKNSCKITRISSNKKRTRSSITKNYRMIKESKLRSSYNRYSC